MEGIYSIGLFLFQFLSSSLICHLLIYETDKKFRDSKTEDLAHLNVEEEDFDEDDKNTDEEDPLENKDQQQ
jgi:hypothetical protein